MSVSPEAACVDKDDRKVATFTYEVEVDESNVDQDFEYEFVVPDDVGDYKFAKGEVSGAESTQLEAGSREGRSGLVVARRDLWCRCKWREVSV